MVKLNSKKDQNRKIILFVSINIIIIIQNKISGLGLSIQAYLEGACTKISHRRMRSWKCHFALAKIHFLSEQAYIFYSGCGKRQQARELTCSWDKALVPLLS